MLPLLLGQSVQQRINDLPATGGAVYFPAGTYRMDFPLNLRDRKKVMIHGDGPATVLLFVLPKAHKGMPLVDMTGARSCTFRDLIIQTGGPNHPSCALLLARSDPNNSAETHRFDRIGIRANCTVANVVNFGSEVNVWTACTFWNASPGGGNYLTGDTPVDSISSPFGGIKGGSDVVHNFFGCTFNVYGRTGTEVNVTLNRGSGYVYFYGGSMTSKARDKADPATGALATFVIGGGKGKRAVYHVHIDGMEGETWGTKNAVQIIGPTYGLSIRRSLFQSLESVIQITGELEDSVVQQNTLDGGLAHYDWVGLPIRSVVSVVDTPVRTSRFNLGYKRLSILDRDKTPQDAGKRPVVAMSVTGTQDFTGNTVIVRHPSDLLIAATVKVEK